MISGRWFQCPQCSWTHITLIHHTITHLGRCFSVSPPDPDTSPETGLLNFQTSQTLEITKWKPPEMRFSFQKGWVPLKGLVMRGWKNPLMSVNSLRHYCHAMLAPAFPWHPLLSLCIFVATCGFGGWVTKLDFIFFLHFFSSTPRGARGKDRRESPLSSNKRKEE